MMNQGTLGALAMAAFTVFATGCDGGHTEDTTTEAPAADDTSAVDPLTTDDDLDGLSENDGDCNDRNDAVFPGARERSLDGVDSDCDGFDAPSLGEDRYEEALGLMDTDLDGSISFEEFSAACAAAASEIETKAALEAPAADSTAVVDNHGANDVLLATAAVTVTAPGGEWHPLHTADAVLAALDAMAAAQPQAAAAAAALRARVRHHVGVRVPTREAVLAAEAGCR